MRADVVVGTAPPCMWLTMSRTVSGDEGAAGMRMSMASVSDISWHETATDIKEYRI
jgi:hypothetical protein